MCLPVFHRLTGKVFPAPSSGCSVSLSSGARSSQQPSALTAPPHYQSISPQGCRRVLGRLLNNSELIFFFCCFLFSFHQVRTSCETHQGTWSWETLEPANVSRPSACLVLESSLSLAPPTGWARRSSTGRDTAAKLMCGKKNNIRWNCNEAQRG